jgi:hypothetical protein
MQNGNWIPLDKALVKFLPRKRAFSEVEAMFSLSLDYDNNNLVTISGYASRWGWSRKRVNGFLEKLGLYIQYPEKTSKKRNQKGHIALHKRDIKGTYKEQIRFIDSKWLSDKGDIKGTYKEQIRDIKGSATINPKSQILNPKSNTCGSSDAFERWWKSYPKRKGRRIGKKNAANLFKKISKKSWPDLKTATENYSVECNGLPKDPERFLRNNFWKNFIKALDSRKESKDDMSEQARITLEQIEETERNQRLATSMPENNSLSYIDTCPEDEIPF